MGIKYFCVTSDSEFIDNPKFLTKQLKKLRIEQRKLSRQVKFSNRWQKQVNVISRLHQKVVDARKDFLHKKSTYFATNYSNIAIEDLKITNMVRSNLSRHISDVSWGAFFDMLEYKANNLVRVHSAYTSQECSKCGHTCKENRVTQSIFNSLFIRCLMNVTSGIPFSFANLVHFSQIGASTNICTCFLFSIYFMF